MKKLINRLLIPVFVVGAVVLPQSLVYAAPTTSDKAFQACGTSASPVCASADNTQVNTLIRTLVNTLLYVLGVIAVIMIIVAGIRYATSGGDASGIKSAKDTILYSVIGLVVAVLAYAIVNFVLGKI